MRAQPPSWKVTDSGCNREVASARFLRNPIPDREQGTKVTTGIVFPPSSWMDPVPFASGKDKMTTGGVREEHPEFGHLKLEPPRGQTSMEMSSRQWVIFERGARARGQR